MHVCRIPSSLAIEFLFILADHYLMKFHCNIMIKPNWIAFGIYSCMLGWSSAIQMFHIIMHTKSMI